MDGKIIRNKLIGSEDERAVSPVIGVILMVAITVILAAVIAAFVLDIGPGGETVSGDASVENVNDSGVELSVTDGSGADEIVVIDSSGNAVDDSKDANTGATVHYDADEGESNANIDEESEYNVYLIAGDIEKEESLDDADGSTQVANFETDEEPES